MQGRPVWLASVSQWRNGRPIQTARWGTGVRRLALDIAHQAVDGVGDPTLERGFLMCLTLCFHRGATDDEIARMPQGPGGLAGPPFAETIWETPDCPPAGLSFAPCENRTTRRLGPPAWKLRMPVDDCGDCPTCEARAGLDTFTMEWPADA